MFDSLNTHSQRSTVRHNVPNLNNITVFQTINCKTREIYGQLLQQYSKSLLKTYKMDEDCGVLQSLHLEYTQKYTKLDSTSHKCWNVRALQLYVMVPVRKISLRDVHHPHSAHNHTTQSLELSIKTHLRIIKHYF